MCIMNVQHIIPVGAIVGDAVGSAELESDTLDHISEDSSPPPFERNELDNECGSMVELMSFQFCIAIAEFEYLTTTSSDARIMRCTSSLLSVELIFFIYGSQ